MTLPNQQTTDDLLAHALAGGRTVARAAQTAGVSENTAYRRLREPAFQARVAELRAVLLDTIKGRITSETLAACQTLTRLMLSQSEGTQLRAAKAVLELALKFNDADRRAGLLGPDAVAPDGTETAPPEAVTAGPEQSAAARPEPSNQSSPAVADPQAEELATSREFVVSAGEGSPPDSPRDTRTGESAPANPALVAEASGPSVGNLSKPVTDCHGSAGELPRPKGRLWRPLAG